jgi:hypothetical protein
MKPTLIFILKAHIHCPIYAKLDTTDLHIMILIIFEFGENRLGRFLRESITLHDPMYRDGVEIILNVNNACVLHHGEHVLQITLPFEPSLLANLQAT